jgi:hypothetical protein
VSGLSSLKSEQMPSRWRVMPQLRRQRRAQAPNILNGLPSFQSESDRRLLSFQIYQVLFQMILKLTQYLLYHQMMLNQIIFLMRAQDYQLPFLGMLVMNFILPFLILMNSDFKRLNWMIVTAGIIILIGHYMDVFNMIMPSAVGDQWFFGIPELGSVMFFAGLFIYIVFSSLTKAPLEASGDPFNKESEKFVY